MSETQWYISIKGKQHGPYPLDRIKKTVDSGGMPDDAHVWRDGWEEWRPWRDVPILFAQTEPSTIHAEAQSETRTDHDSTSQHQELNLPQRERADQSVTFAPVETRPASSYRARQANIKWIDYFTFRKMVTPVVILVVYWVGVVGITLFSAFTLITFGAALFMGPSSDVIGIGIAMVGFLFLAIPLIILWRVYCEVIAVLFRIYETLTDISEKLDRQRFET